MSNDKHPSHSPYGGTMGRASGNYEALAKRHATPREIEAQALLKAARLLQDLQNNWSDTKPNDIEETLKYNRQIWLIFYEHALEAQDKSTAPQKQTSLHSNVINLAGFVFKKSMDILADPDKQKLSVLININREVAAGLMTRQ